MEHPVECRSSDRPTRIAHRRMRIHRQPQRICLALWVLVAIVAVRPAGVTVITHGLEGEVTGWVRPLGYAMFGEDATYYQFTITRDQSQTYVRQVRLGGPSFSESKSGEIVVALDWSQMADFAFLASSTEVAEALVFVLTMPGYLAELGGHPLVDFPIHLVGHSRGGSVVCESARLLGERGIWVDHLTTLDPHPIEFPYGDGPARVYANVLFADNYYQQLDFFTYGEEVAGAYNRELTSLPGAYAKNHSNVHVWYHATADLAVPTYYWDADDKLQIDITSHIRSQ
jgi:hypothetical protein